MTTPPRGDRRRRFLVRLLLGLAITSGLLLFLFRYIDTSHLAELFAAMTWGPWLLGGGLWVLLYLARAVRFSLLAPRTPYHTMVCIASVHNLLVRLLPLRTGDVSYAFLVRRVGTAGLGESLLGLLLLRLMDAATVVVVFSTALLLDHGVYLGDRRIGILAAGAGTAVFVLAVVGLPRLLRLGLRLGQGLSRLTGLERSPRIKELLERIEMSVGSFSRLRPPTMVAMAMVSLLIWLLTFGAFFAIMRAFSMPVSFAQTTLGATAGVVSGFLPIGGIGSFGTLEVGWSLGFALVGLERTMAVSSAFGVSITTFIYAVVLGLLGWVGLVLLR